MSTKSHTLWLLAALAAPVAHFSGCGWLPALLAAAVFLPLTVLPANWENLSKPFALLQMAWLGLIAGSLLKDAAVYWPSGNDLVVPFTLLILATLTNPDSAGRIGTVLAFCLLVLAIPTAWSAATTLEFAWLKPAVSGWPVALSIVLLLPALPSGERSGKQLLPLLALSAILGLLTQGVLSPRVAASQPDAFYQMARTLGHMEPIVAAAMTLGYFALMCHITATGRRLALSSGLPRFLSLFLLPIIAGICILTDGAFLNGKTLFGSLILWIFTPFARGLFCRKTTQMNFE